MNVSSFVFNNLKTFKLKRAEISRKRTESEFPGYIHIILHNVS